MPIDAARIHTLNRKPVRRAGRFVLYWMQQSQRAEWNHALEYTIERANELGLPPAAVFGLTDRYPEANERHCAFMLEGLDETLEALRARGLAAAIGRGDPAEVALRIGAHAALIVCDTGYLRHQAAWRARVAEEAECAVVEIESDVVVPVETASDHAEYMARTLRPKLLRRVRDHGQAPSAVPPAVAGVSGAGLPSFRAAAWKDLLPCAPEMRTLRLDRSAGKVARFKGGAAEARRRLRRFVTQRLDHYGRNSHQPQTDGISELSPYLHFGQISALEIAHRIRASAAPENEKEAFLEQLIVRRELAVNFVWYTRDYDRWACLPDWARHTLEHHARDRRATLYSREDLEFSRTRDPYWNAAMTEMRESGFMHNYMRMYWGKKILEWTRSPQEAFQIVLSLNNRYFLDGRDPNSYAGAAWIFGKHDQAWQERPVFGKTRTMNAAGLQRKCDIQAYVDKVAKYRNEE
jgi:deoxyribodipyrimidine photo-lyase